MTAIAIGCDQCDHVARTVDDVVRHGCPLNGWYEIETARQKPPRNKNLSGCQSRLYWSHGVAAKCSLPEGHPGRHVTSSRSWDDHDAANNAARYGRSQ